MCRPARIAPRPSASCGRRAWTVTAPSRTGGGSDARACPVSAAAQAARARPPGAARGGRQPTRAVPRDEARMRLLLPLWLASAALAANVTLTLTAPTTATAPGAAVAVPVTLTSVAGYEPAGLLFTVTWSAADLSAVSFALATGISKTGWCNPSAGELVCAIAGLNLTKMANGTLGTLTATVAATAGVTTTTLPLGPVSAGAPNAAPLDGVPCHRRQLCRVHVNPCAIGWRTKGVPSRGTGRLLRGLCGGAGTNKAA